MSQDNRGGEMLPDQSRGGYSSEELNCIYELGRVYLENGNIQGAQTIMTGLCTVAPDFASAWLGLCYINVFQKNHEAALEAARRAEQSAPESVEAQLFLVACLLTTGDFQTAGSLLGEVGDKVDGGMVTNPYLIRFFRAQLARYQAR